MINIDIRTISKNHPRKYTLAWIYIFLIFYLRVIWYLQQNNEKERKQNERIGEERITDVHGARLLSQA